MGPHGHLLVEGQQAGVIQLVDPVANQSLIGQGKRIGGTHACPNLGRFAVDLLEQETMGQRARSHPVQTGNKGAWFRNQLIEGGTWKEIKAPAVSSRGIVATGAVRIEDGLNV